MLHQNIDWHELIVTSRTFAEFVLRQPYTDKELASTTAVNASTVYRWKFGQNVPDIGTIVQLALALNISPGDAEILIRKTRQAFGAEKHDYELLKKLYREPAKARTIDAEYECYADITDRDFATALRRILAWRGLTQKQFAEKCGVGEYQVSKWLSRKIAPNIDKISAALTLPKPITHELKNIFTR